jgi:glycosyltransferase involved in cell wall biosynthesis
MVYFELIGKRNILIGAVEFEFFGGNRNSVQLFTSYFQKKFNISIITPKNFINFTRFHKIEKNYEIYSIFSLYPLVSINNTLWSILAYPFLLKKDVYQGIGGTFLGAEPYCFWRKPYFLWIGTTFLDEFNNVTKLEKNISLISQIIRRIQQRTLKKIIKIEKKVYSNALKIFSQSRYTTNILIEKYKINKKKIVMVPCPLKSNLLNIALKNKTLNQNQRYFITVSRLDPRKNLKELIEIFTKFDYNSKYHDYSLYILGDGNQKGELIEYCKKLKIDSKVKIISNLSDLEVYSYVSHATLYLSTSLQEGFGISILESMYLKTPIIIYDNGGSNEYLTNNLNGIIIEPHNQERFVNSIMNLISNEIIKEKMVQAAHQTALNYSSEKIFAIIESYYTKNGV